MLSVYFRYNIYILDLADARRKLLNATLLLGANSTLGQVLMGSHAGVAPALPVLYMPELDRQVVISFSLNTFRTLQTHS